MIGKSINDFFERLLARGAVSTSSGLHLNCMDGLRGLAILMVVCGHGFYYNSNGPHVLATIGKLIGSGWIGVPIFFVLSGFLISYPFFQARLKDPQFWYPRGYATRRILKIFPPFYLAIVGFAVFDYLRYRDVAFFTTGLQWATGVAHFVPVSRDLNGSFWSLWVELQFYLLLPLLFFLFRGASARSVSWGLFFIFTLVPPVTRALTWPGDAVREQFDVTVRRFPNALDNFAWGILLAGIYVAANLSSGFTRRRARLGYVGLVLLVISGAVLALVEFPPRLNLEFQRFLPGVAAFLMCFFIFDAQSLGSRIFSAPVLRFTGVISFEWFLLHQPVQGFFRQIIGSTQGKLPLYLFTVVTPSVLTFVAAALIYFNFSLPILRWGRNRLAARKKASGATAIPVAGEAGTPPR